MIRAVALGIVMAAGVAAAQSPATSFEVATIKPVDPGPKAGRFLRMENDHRFVATNFTLKLLIAAAYDLNPRTISGGPGWVDADKFTIEALTPGDKRPDHDQQMLMLRTLLHDRFHLAFHRVSKVFSIYEITVAKGGIQFDTTGAPNRDPMVTSVVYPDHLEMPARNASMDDLARVMQRAILDRPVVNKTGLTGHYDFALDWAPDETQFGGAIPTPQDSKSPPLLVAMREQLGLEMKATRGPIDTLVIDKADKPESD
ncbi:TIGR03435 family protein [Terriglobus sp. RCC_193]|uniref:TIGR03435 family protein n=1 Tax=Terriglobus sp. RCC_193 TaxID=3239218 RepID=UPI00352331EE